MGQFPARIVAEDFVTPPEFASWKLASEGSGRIGGARFAIAERNGASHLAGIYEQIPLRVSPLDLGPSEPALVYLLNPTAGLMDGDAHLLAIEAGPGTRAVVTGQSATRIHPCQNGFCTQQWNISVADGAVLAVLPGPAIPFTGCRYFQHIRIELGKNAGLVWGDIWFAGRYARNDVSERFRFDCIVQEMLVYRQRQMVYRDRFHWQGPWDEANARWHFGGYPAAGSIFASGLVPMDFMPDIAGAEAAIFPTGAGDACCRLVGTSEAVVASVVQSSLRCASRLANNAAGEPWLLAGRHLAATHWFGAI